MKSNLKIMRMVSVSSMILLAIFLTACGGGGGGGDGSAPSPPTGVTPKPGDEEVTISWDTASGATSYNIYWAYTSGVSKADYEDKISTITTTSYLHTGLTNGTTYYYVVTAENDYGESDESDEVSAMPTSAPGEWDSMIWDQDTWGE